MQLTRQLTAQLVDWWKKRQLNIKQDSWIGSVRHLSHVYDYTVRIAWIPNKSGITHALKKASTWCAIYVYVRIYSSRLFTLAFLQQDNWFRSWDELRAREWRRRRRRRHGRRRMLLQCDIATDVHSKRSSIISKLVRIYATFKWCCNRMLYSAVFSRVA